MVIYTKKGDHGQTSIYDPGNTQTTRVSKDSLKVEAIGAIDELNTFIGLSTSFSKDPIINRKLKNIQTNLFKIGSILAGSGLKFSRVETTRLESEIDKIEARLPVIKNFVVVTGKLLAVHLQYSRTIARRAERRVVGLSNDNSIPETILSYLNRLPTFAFEVQHFNYKLLNSGSMSSFS